MKHLSIIIVLILSIACSGQDKKLKRYEVKSAIIHYTSTISGKVMGGTISGSGTSELYFKDWGDIELSEENSNQTTTMKMFGNETTQTTKSHIMKKLNSGESYNVDFEKEKIFVIRDPLIDYMKQTDTDADDAGKSMLESMGGKNIGNETFQGYNCEIWEFAGGKQWLYKGAMLKLEMTVLGITTTTVATSVKFDINVPEKHFQLPNFPIKKEESFLDNESMDEEMEDMDVKLDQLSKLTYEEWKKMALSDKENAKMQNMSEVEMHKMYDMMLKMVKAKQSK
jgi:hypothetical protein